MTKQSRVLITPLSFFVFFFFFFFCSVSLHLLLLLFLLHLHLLLSVICGGGCPAGCITLLTIFLSHHKSPQKRKILSSDHPQANSMVYFPCLCVHAIVRYPLLIWTLTTLRALIFFSAVEGKRQSPVIIIMVGGQQWKLPFPLFLQLKQANHLDFIGYQHRYYQKLQQLSSFSHSKLHLLLLQKATMTVEQQQTQSSKNLTPTASTLLAICLEVFAAATETSSFSSSLSLPPPLSFSCPWTYCLVWNWCHLFAISLL